MRRDLLRRFLVTKARGLRSRSRRLVALTPEEVGLRREDMAYAPSAAHFAAANKRLASIDGTIKLRLEQLAGVASGARPDDALLAMAMVEREIDRARRTFGMFFEVFAQRGTAFAPALAAHDAIAADCYAAVQATSPGIFGGPILKPLTYMEHGYSPATMRRGISLSRLLGEPNPFPLVRIPWDRDRPWQAEYLHEISHNLQADLGLWVENRQALMVRLAGDRHAPRVVSIFGRWHKEIFADLAAMLLGGPAVAWGMAEFLSHPADKVMTYRPGGPHPTGYLRVFILAEMLRRLGFPRDAASLTDVWSRLYDPRRGHRIPKMLMIHARRAIPAVVDEIAFQARRGLAERTLAGVIRFTAADQALIGSGAASLAQGRFPSELPPRFIVSACRYALEFGAAMPKLSHLAIAHLSRPALRLIQAAQIAPARMPARAAVAAKAA